ncbi:putative ribonuclease H-like domain-containing protein [Tanacetum coccineum]
MALPEDHLSKFHKITDAKEMWHAIKSRFGGNDKSKKMQKYILKQQFEGFSVSNSKGLHKAMTGVDSLSFDDLYNNLRVFENDVKGSTASSSSTQNVAFVSENTSSTNDVSIAYSVSNTSGSWNRLVEFDLEKMDLKWQVAMISMRMKKFYKKIGRKLQFDAKEPVGFDKTKVKEGIDWTSHSEEEEDYALIACNSSGSDTEAVLTSAAVKVNTVEPIVNRIRPTNVFHKTHSPFSKHFNKTTALRTTFSKQKVNTAKDYTHRSFYRTKELLIEDVPRHMMETRPNLLISIVDSECSRHLTRNKAHLAEYQDYNGGPVAFRDTECLVLSPDFKLPDENQVLLRVPRQNNMYSFNLENIVPSGGLACLIAKATVDESNKWHRRLGHVNFKNLNKLVKGNLVRGLPSKIFQNDHTCVACQKGKQHKASCKAKSVSSISQPLQLLHMDLFGPTSVRSLNHKTYCLVITDDFSRFSWVFFLRTKDETSGILKDFIRQIENQLNQKVKTIRCDNGTEFKNRDFIELCGSKGIKREYSNARTPQQNRVAERKNRTLIKAARTMLADSFLPNTFWAEAVSTACYVLNKIFLVGYSLQSKAFRVYNLETKRVEENLHINFLENKPNVAGKGPTWLFDLDYLTDSMNYHSVRSENQANIHAGQQESNQNTGTKDKIDAGDSEKEDESAQDCFELPIWHSYSSTNTSASKSDNKRGGPREEEQVFLDDLARLQRQEKEANEEAEALRKNLEQETKNLVTQAEAAKSSSTNIFSTVSTTAKASGTNLVNTVSIPVSTASLNERLSNSDTTNSQERGGVQEADFTNLETIVNVSPIPTSRINPSHPSALILGDPTLAVQTRSKMDVKSAFPLCKIDEEKFDFASVKTASTPIETQKPLVKDEEASDVDVHLYRSMIGSLMYLKGKPKLGLWYPKSASFEMVLKSPTNDNVADLLTKAFDVSRFQFLVVQLGCKNSLVKHFEDMRLCRPSKEYLPVWFDPPRDVSMSCLTTKGMRNNGAKCASLDKVSTDHAKLVPLGKVCTAKETLEKNTAKGTKCKLEPLISLTDDLSLLSNMAALESCPKHNMIAYLEKTEGNVEFHEFWTSAKSKTINNVRHITAKVAGKLVSITEASIRTDLLFHDADGIDTLPNQAIFDAIQLMGYEGDLTDEGATSERLSEAQPSPSSEAPNESLPDSSSAQSSEVPFEQQPDLSPSPSPRPSPNPSPTPIVPDSIPEPTGENLGDHSFNDTSLSGNEDAMTLQNVYDLCISLCKQVSDQAKEIELLKAKIKRLKKKATPVINHFKAYQKRISKEQRQQRKRSSKKKRVQKESVSKQGRKNAKGDGKAKENAQSEGRTKEMMDEDKETDEVGLSTEDEVSTAKEGVSTDRPKLSTDDLKVSTDEQMESNDDQVDVSEEIFEGTEDQKVSTEEQSKEEIASQASQTSSLTPTSVIFGDDETYLHTTSQQHEDQHSLLKPLPKIDPKDKGKKKIEEEDETESEDDDIPQVVKKFKQLENDEELARKVQEEWEAEEEKNKIAEEEAANEALIKNFDDVKARIEADRILAEKLQEQEREQFTIEERAKFLHDTILNKKRGGLSKSEVIKEDTKEEVKDEDKDEEMFRKRKINYQDEMPEEVLKEFLGRFHGEEVPFKRRNYGAMLNLRLSLKKKVQCIGIVKDLSSKVKTFAGETLRIIMSKADGSDKGRKKIERRMKLKVKMMYSHVVETNNRLENDERQNSSEKLHEQDREREVNEDKDEESTRKRKLGTRKKMKSRKRRYIQHTSEDDSDKENDDLRLYLTIAQDEDKEVDYEFRDENIQISDWRQVKDIQKRTKTKQNGQNQA